MCVNITMSIIWLYIHIRACLYMRFSVGRALFFNVTKVKSEEGAEDTRKLQRPGVES